jgi:acyl-CoA synthetase (NDP forming)
LKAKSTRSTRHETILGKRVYPSLGQICQPVDLAIVALNERATIDILDELGRYDVKAAVCVAGGYSEIGEGGEELQQALADAAARNRVLLVGPNTLGVINARVGLNATFWPERLRTGGEVSVITQSGGVGQMIICKAQEEWGPEQVDRRRQSRRPGLRWLQCLLRIPQRRSSQPSSKEPIRRAPSSSWRRR